jgi:O-antigen ligase
MLLPARKGNLHDWVNHDFIWLLILSTVVVAGNDAFNFFFIILCVRAFFDRKYSIPLLFFSGYLKIIPIVSDLPVDFTALVLVFFIFYTTLNTYNKRNTIGKNKMIVTLVLAVMLVVTLLSFFTTPATSSYLTKSGIYLILNLILTMLILLFWDVKEPDRVIVPFSNFATAIGILWIGQGLHNDIFNVVVLDSTQTPMWHISSFGEDYMVFSTFVILLIVKFGIFFIWEKKSIIAAILLIIFSYCMVASPARGLTIGFLISLVFVYAYAFNGKIGLKTISVMAILFIAVIGLIFAFQEDLAITLNRLTTFDTRTRSINYRIEGIQFALDKWSDKILFGTGIDSIMYFKNAPGGHVHNVLLEAVVELGLVGGLPFLLFFALAFYCFHRLLKLAIKLHHPHLLWISMIFLIFFIFSLFSGSLSQIRPLWVIMALAISMSFDYLPLNAKSQLSSDQHEHA